MGGNNWRSACISKSSIAVPLLLCLLLATSVCAQDQTISQMVHTSWTGHDGAPQAITALAQTPDGMLWISTIAGLYKFDGVSFSAFRPLPEEPSLPGLAVYSLYVSKTGDLWVMFRQGGTARIRQGHVTVFDRVDLKSGRITLTHLQQDPNGMMWAVLNEQRLLSLGLDQTWHPTVGPIRDPAHITSLFIDSAGTQWVVANDLLYRRPTGQVSFSPTEIHAAGGTKLAEAPDHTVWVIGQVPRTGKVGHGVDLQRIDRSGKRLPCPPVVGDLRDILPAQDGSVWLSKAGEGLLRLPKADMAAYDPRNPTEAPDLYTISDGLTSVQEWALLSDADGNVWAGGASGLDRFEYATLIPAIGGAHPGYWYTCANQQGDVWGAEQQGPLFSFAHGHANRIPGGEDIGGLFCGLDKKVWMIDRRGLGLIQNGRIQRLPVIPGQPQYRDYYRFISLTEVAKDELVAVTLGALGDGLWIFRRGKWQPFLAGHAGNRINVVKAAGGHLYLGYRDGKIEVFQPETGQKLSTADPGVGEMVALSQTAYGVFALGYDGIAAEHGNTFERLSFLHRDSAARVCGLVESRNGDFWLNGARGIVRIPHSEMVAAIANPGHLISSDQVQEGNFVGPAFCPVGIESASTDASGKLWFATLNGVVSLDPENTSLPRRPPQLSIRTITADGHPLNANGTFPPDTQYLDINYFGLDLTNPKNVVYRYRLEGLDTTWQNVGNRTEAIYTHLRPGTYRFQVIASNGNDVWTKPVTSAMFRILPRFYEKPGFQALCLLAGLLLVWFGISLRVRYVSSAIRIRAEERADERIRIARELHDTLLQGIQGLLLTFHVAAEKVPADHVSKKALEKALTTADCIIVEGRNRVSRLRSENLTDAELKSLIEGVASNLNGIAAIDFAVERMGGTDILQSHVVDEVFCIAREALTNAFRHSGASRIVVELNYQKGQFMMSCCDNGRGFDAEAFHASPTNGHWGLRGMRERAERVGGSFSFTSAPDKGTAVHITMPARLAYVSPSVPGFFRSKHCRIATP
jgi:signal transduction histidine kinase/ligand-binding sensor domain-containing protein